VHAAEVQARRHPAALRTSWQPRPRVRVGTRAAAGPGTSVRSSAGARVEHPGRAVGPSAAVYPRPVVPGRPRPWWDGRALGGWLVLGLTAVAAVVLTAGIGVPWPWSDEGATYLAVQRSWDGLAVLFGSRDAPWVPYYALAKAWTIGTHAILPGVSTLVAVRTLSAVAAVATVGTLYAIVARNAGRLAGVLAGLLLISLPGFDRYAQEARGYAVLAFAATLSWLLLDRRLRPGREPTLLGSTITEARLLRAGGAAESASAAGYALSLAGVAAIHTFGLFQWPAHLVETLAAPATGPARRRRLGAFLVVATVAALLAAAQLLVSLEHGTGPSSPQAGRVVTPAAVMVQLVRGISVTPVPAVSIPVLLLALAGALSRVDRSREFPRSLAIWLCVPLVLEIGLGAVRTNLFRLRYWIAFLPPLAALAALGIVMLATAAARLVRRVPIRSGGWLGRGTAVLAAVLVLGVQAGATLQPQEQVRAPDGHSENLSRVMAIVGEAQAAHPGLVTAITSATASGMLAAADPKLLAENPMRRLDEAAATVYTSVTPASVIRERLIGAHDVLWIHSGSESPAGAVRLIPHVLRTLHPTVLWARAAGTGWTAVLLKLPRGSA